MSRYFCDYVHLRFYDFAAHGIAPLKNSRLWDQGSQEGEEVRRVEALAEAVRFELTEHFCSAVFKTAGLNHSPKLPRGGIIDESLTRPAARYLVEMLGVASHNQFYAKF